MADIQQIYHELELTLNEFFNPTTSNQRKHEIDNALQSFQNSPMSLPLALHCLEHSQNQYILMYSLHLLQTIIETRWLRCDDNTKSQIKETIMRMIPPFFVSCPAFLSNKMLTIFADIGRLEWPSKFPTFFSHIYVVSVFFEEYLSEPGTTNLGLNLLRITLEEFQNENVKSSCLLLSFEQKECLKLNLRAEYEKILAILCKIADSLVSLYRNTMSEASSENFLHSVQIYFSRSSKYPRISPEDEKIAANVLKCLATYYQTLDLFFVLKMLPLLDFVMGLSFLGVRHNDDDGDVEILALNCLMELMTRNYPSDFDVHRLKLFEYLYILVCELNSLEFVAGAADLKSKLTQLNESWLTKVVELMRLFFVNHFHRYDGRDEWPCVDLLQKFLMLTDNFSSLDLFMHSLEGWNVFLDYLGAKVESKTKEDNLASLSYEPLFEVAVSVLLCKMHVSNKTSLFDLDDVEFGESFDTSDWGHFLITCCDLLAKIAEFHPLSVFHALKSSFDTKLNAYFDLTNVEKITTVNVNQLVVFLLDFQSVLKGLGCLAHLFINESFWKFNAEAKDFVENLCRAIVFSGRTKLFLADENVIGGRLKREAANIFAQFLLCIRSYCHWLAQFYADAQRTGENNVAVSAIISSTVDCVVPLLNPSFPSILIHAAVSTLYSVLITIRPQQYLLNMESVRFLYDEASKLTFLNFSPEIYKVLYGSLVNYLILPWYNATDCEQEWTTRKPMYQKLMKELLKDYLNLCNAESRAAIDIQSAKRTVEIIVPIIVEMLDSITNESVTTKKFCYTVLKPAASNTLRLLHVFVDRLDFMEQLLLFVSSMFHALIVQLGPDFTKDAVQTLLHTTQSQNLVELLKSENSSTCKVLELVLKILHCLLKEMSKSFHQFTPSVIQLSLHNLKPVLMQTSSVDLKASFFELLHSLLVIRWRYFFPVNILTSMENHELGEKTEHADEFLEVLQTFGQSLSDSEPSLIKQNLGYLNSLNVKWNLYKRNIFIKNLYPHFAQAFLSLLVNRTYQILNEDFCDTLALMTCCCEETLNLFRSQLLKQFLISLNDLRSEQIDELNDKFQLHNEMPAFSVALQKLCNDVFVCRLCNC